SDRDGNGGLRLHGNQQRGDALQGSGFYGDEALQRHLLEHLQAAGKRKSGMLTGGHSVGCSELIGRLVTSSHSNPIWMSAGYNLLRHHS
ncbi:hypothetical protein, partial [Ralstonia sp.]